MSTKYVKSIGVVVVVVAMLLTLGTSALFAQDVVFTPGDGPGTAVHPSIEAVTIAPQSWQWYSFRAQVPLNGDANDATIDATLRRISGKVDFEVWSADNLRSWINNSKFDPMGMGTKNKSINGDPIFWQGSFIANDTFYLIVQNKSSKAATYTLDITGDVSFPSELALSSTAPVAQAAAPVMSSGEMALTVDLPAETVWGAGPATTLMPTSGYVMIPGNTWQWYSFYSQVPVHVDGPGAADANAVINALLRTKANKVSFEIWSADNLNTWINDKAFNPLGMGTENKSISGDPLFWQGSFSHNSQYYLIVMNRSATPVYYSLAVTGDVSFPSAHSLSVQ